MFKVEGGYDVHVSDFLPDLISPVQRTVRQPLSTSVKNRLGTNKSSPSGMILKQSVACLAGPQALRRMASAT